MKCEMCDNFDPAKYIASVKTQKGIEIKYLCIPCARELEKLGLAINIQEIIIDDWED